MSEITIRADDHLIDALHSIALQESVSVEDVARDALSTYILAHRRTRAKTYSFIGIGRSGQNDLSSRVEEILEQEADRREGWSLR